RDEGHRAQDGARVPELRHGQLGAAARRHGTGPCAGRAARAVPRPAVSLTHRFLCTAFAPGGCARSKMTLSAGLRSHAPIAQMDRASDYETGGAGNQLASASTIFDVRRGEGYGLAVTWRRAKTAPLLGVGRISFATPFATLPDLSTYPQASMEIPLSRRDLDLL